MHRVHILTAGVLAATLFAGSTALAQGPRRGPGGPGRPGGPVGLGIPLAALNLTEQQRQQIRDVTGRSRDDVRQLRQRLEKARQAQHEAIAAAPVDEARIRAAAQEVAEVQADAAVQRARIRAEVFELLTPEQREQANKLAADRRAQVTDRGAQLREGRHQRRGNAQNPQNQ